MPTLGKQLCFFSFKAYCDLVTIVNLTFGGDIINLALCLCMVLQNEVFSILILVFTFLFFSYFRKITGESCTPQIVFILKWFGVVIISLLFNLTLSKVKIHFFWVEMWLILRTYLSYLFFRQLEITFLC